MNSILKKLIKDIDDDDLISLFYFVYDELEKRGFDINV